MSWASIDPGMKGAIVFWEGSVPYHWEKLPWNGNYMNVQAFVSLLKQHKVGLVMVEKVGGISGQGASMAFTFGRGLGQILGCLEALGIAYREVAGWYLTAHQGLPKKMDPKDRSRAFAARCYPSMNLVGERCKVADDGACDALGIGHHAIAKGWIKKEEEDEIV